MHALLQVSDLTTKTVRRKGRSAKHAQAPQLVVAYSADVDAIGRRWQLDEEICLVGRRAEGRGRIDDPALSRQHFRIQPETNGRLTLVDLGGSNGTFVDGVRVLAPLPLRGQEVISAGDTLFIVDAAMARDELPRKGNVEAHIPQILGASLGAQAIRSSLGTVAQEAGNVLVLGSTGTGKELAAQAIHALSDRTGDIVATNCAAIPKDLAESELFGHVKGAFTGADSSRDGYFVRADGGTLFLDEVGELPEPVQAKLLRVLETGEVTPVGASASVKVDVRVVAATLRNLSETAFRKDLFARLGDWVLRLPDLKDRRADILTLFDHFSGSPPQRRYDADVAEALLLYEWPMNVRELAKVAARTCALTEGRDIEVYDLPASFESLVPHRLEFQEEEPDEPANPDIAQIPGLPPRSELETLLAETKGNVKEAALRRDWHRTQLYRWIKRSGIDTARFRD
jgi:DNA-binding NtrC family response regulator